MKKAHGSDIFLWVLYYQVKSWYISQENQVGTDSGVGIMNYMMMMMMMMMMMNCFCDIVDR